MIANAAAGSRDGLVLGVETGNPAGRSVYRTVGFEAIERLGDLRMRLDLDDPIATGVRWPPVIRDGSTGSLVRAAAGGPGPGRSPGGD